MSLGKLSFNSENAYTIDAAGVSGHCKNPILDGNRLYVPNHDDAETIKNLFANSKITNYT